MGFLCKRGWLAALLLAGRALAQDAPGAVTPDEAARIEFARGVQLLRERQHRGAVDAFEQATKLAPKFYEAYVNWGVALTLLGQDSRQTAIRLQRFQEATSRFEQAAELRPASKLTYQLWADTLTAAGDLPVEPATRLACYTGAAAKYRHATELDPHDWQSWNQLGKLLTSRLADFTRDRTSRRQLYQEAAGLFAKAAHQARFSADIGQANANWGEALTNEARWTDDAAAAEAALRQALDKFDASAKAMSKVAGTYAAWGAALVQLGKVTGLLTNYRLAIEQYKQSVQLESDNPAVLFQLASAYALNEDAVLAVQTLERCLKLDDSGTYLARVETDPDWRTVRGQSVYAELLRRSRR